MGNSDLDGMGGGIALLVGVVVLIIVLLKDSEKKIKTNAEAKLKSEQQAASSQFKREFGTNQAFDSSDFYIANRVVDYAKAGGDKLETISNVAGLFGTVKSVIAKESSQATAKLIKDQIEQHRNNKEIPVQAPHQIPHQPIYIQPPQQPQEPPVYFEPPRRRRVYYDDDIEYFQRPRKGFYNHYE